MKKCNQLQSFLSGHENWHRRQICQLFHIRPGYRILDVGCGSGRSTFQLAMQVRPGGRVVGITIDNNELKLARERAESFGLGKIVTFRQQDVISHLRQQDNVYDAIVFVGSLQYMEVPLTDLWSLVARRSRFLGVGDQISHSSDAPGLLNLLASWLLCDLHLALTGRPEHLLLTVEEIRNSILAVGYKIMEERIITTPEGLGEDLFCRHDWKALRKRVGVIADPQLRAIYRSRIETLLQLQLTGLTSWSTDYFAMFARSPTRQASHSACRGPLDYR